MARLILIPVLVVMMSWGSDLAIRLAFVIFVIAALTDLADGWLARGMRVVSDFGKLLDPVADKVLVMAALVMLVAQRSGIDGQPWVPGWMVVLVLAREFWVTGLRAIAAQHGRVVPAGSAGKIKSLIQMVAIGALLLHNTPLITMHGRLVPAQIIGENLLMLSIVVSYWGAGWYTYEIFRLVGRGKQESTEA